MMDKPLLPSVEEATPRISIVFIVALGNYLCHALIRYSTPLYFSALGYPNDAYETFSFYWLAAFIASSSFSGLLASRIDERSIWGWGLIGFAGLGILLIYIPSAQVVPFTGILYGITGAAQWVGAMSFVQTVTPERRGRSNGLLMIALGIGSFIGPMVGGKLLELVSTTDPVFGNYAFLFWFHVVICFLGALTIWLFGRYSGPVRQKSMQIGWRTNLSLLRMPRYLAMVIPLSLMGGPVFQTVNIYLQYRVRDPDIALIVGSIDHGWASLLTAGYGMQLLGGIAILMIAGKKCGAAIASGILGAYAACSLGIGFSTHASAVVISVCLFEFLRQLMRWSQTGYISEHMPIELRAPAIGFSTTLSGLSSTLFAFVLKNLQSPNSPDFSSSFPFFVGGCIGLTGAILLLISHATILNSGEHRTNHAN